MFDWYGICLWDHGMRVAFGFCWNIYARVRSLHEMGVVYYRGSSHVVQDLEGYYPAARFAPLSSPLIEENMIQLSHHFRTYPLQERESICPVFLMYRDTWYLLQVCWY
jgi:hypothetical protein